MGYEGPPPDPDALSVGTIETTFTDRRAAAAVATAATGPRYTDLTPLTPAEGLGKGRGSGVSKQVRVYPFLHTHHLTPLLSPRLHSNSTYPPLPH